jgi:AAA15 family ATPase/GTPase
MEMLRFIVKGHSLFKDDVDISFVNEERVTDMNDTSLHWLFGNVYSFEVLAIAGINASGKSTILKLMTNILQMYQSKDSIDDVSFPHVFEREKLTIIAYFVDADKKKIFKIISCISPSIVDGQVLFNSEEVYFRTVASVTSRVDLFRDDKFSIADIREELLGRPEGRFLTSNRTMFLAYRGENRPIISELISSTNMNILSLKGDVPTEIVKYLDPSIEFISQELNMPGANRYRIKFVGQEKEIVTTDAGLENYLSSGTIKGIATFQLIRNVLQSGGYLLIDELENHFNHAIVESIIRFFTSKHVNKKGAMLIYSTHYSELLDSFERRDNVLITTKSDTIRIKPFSALGVRSAVKKSNVYDNAQILPTAPVYESYMDVQNYLLFQQDEER